MLDRASPFRLTLTLTVDEAGGEALLTRLRTELVNVLRSVALPPRIERFEVSAAPRPYLQKAVAPEKLLWNSVETAKALHVSERTLWTMWKTGQMPPPIKIGNCVRWSPEVLRAWIAKRGMVEEGPSTSEQPTGEARP